MQKGQSNSRPAEKTMDDDTALKEAKENDDDLPQNENQNTEEIFNSKEENLNGAGKSPERRASKLPNGATCRTDRYGVDIVPRKFRLDKNLKSTHKVTFLDQVLNQPTEEDPNEKKTKRLIKTEADENKNIVNIFYVESYKRYNAMEVDELANNNAICKCAIF